MDIHKLKTIIEAALLAAGRPLGLDQLERLFPEEQGRPARSVIRQALDLLHAECADRGFELKHVASGYRYQVRADLKHWMARLWEERPPRYSRALLETLALIAYRQPITRGEIEEVRGVSVSSSIIKTLLERDWIRVLGHRDVPGRPAMYGSTREFLNYFNLKSLDELPPLAELVNLDKVHPQLELETPPVAETGERGDVPDRAGDDIGVSEGRDDAASRATDARNESEPEISLPVAGQRH
ncbi:MAG: SMC-Scp complex subunit ScpB [Gammaproteobacteria bacterium]